MGSKISIKWVTICNKLLEGGVLFLVIFCPLAFGAVHVWAYSLMEFVIFLLAIVWAIKSCFLRTLHKSERLKTSSEHKDDAFHPNDEFIRGRMGEKDRSLSKLGFLCVPILLFFILIGFQLLPLSPALLKQISPATYDIYASHLPGYLSEKGDPSFSKVQEIGIRLNSGFTNSTGGPYRTISLNGYFTKTIFIKIFSYVIIFFLIANNFMFDESLLERTKERVRLGKKNHNFSSKRIRSDPIRIPIHRLILVIFFTGGAISLLGMLQHLSGTSKIFWLRDASYAGPFGTYINRNHFAGYVNMIIPIGLAIFLVRQAILYPSGGGASNLFVRLKKFLLSLEPWLAKNGLHVFALIIMAWSLILSSSRSGFICFVISLFLFIFLCIFNKDKSHTSVSRLKILAVIGTFLLVIFLWTDMTHLNRRFVLLKQVERFLGHGRIRANVVAWKMGNEFFYFGAGLGVFPELYFKFRGERIAEVWYREAHNDYFQLLAETGICGVFLLLVLIVLYFFFLIKGYRRSKNINSKYLAAGGIAGIVTMLIHSFSDFNMQIPANALQFSVIAGITWILLFNSSRSNFKKAGYAE